MDEKGKPGFMVYFTLESALALLNDEQSGRLFKSMFAFARDGIRPDFADDPKLQMAFAFVEPALVADDERYNQKVLKRRFAAFCKVEKDAGRVPPNFNGWLQMQSCDSMCYQVQPIPDSISTSISDPVSISETESISESNTNSSVAASPPPARFVPPDVGEVTDYCLEKGYNIDASRFVDYYQARGWRLGNVAMADWKSAVNTWAAREKNFGNGKDTAADPYLERWKSLPGQVIL